MRPRPRATSLGRGGRAIAGGGQMTAPSSAAGQVAEQGYSAAVSPAQASA
ncbi:UNVERIFIED_CONTAM: hypothetical protein RF648_10165 [Kocuria sp. CPCC 205274]